MYSNISSAAGTDDSGASSLQGCASKIDRAYSLVPEPAATLGEICERCQHRILHRSADAYPPFNAIRDGRSDHGIVATLLGRCDRVILELSLVGFLSPLARKFDTYP